MNKLIYSRLNAESINQSVETYCEALKSVGIQTELTHSTNLARLILNPYDTLHFFIDKLPLRLNEAVFLSFAKTLGKVTVLSILENPKKNQKSFLEIFSVDALTVSQSNFMQYFRDWSCTKMVLPLFPELNLLNKEKKTDLTTSFYPLIKNLDEAFAISKDQEIYFDGLMLLKTSTATELRKKWTQYRQQNKIGLKHHLILSLDKRTELLTDESLVIILACPENSHTDITNWLGRTLNKKHHLILNEYQATGFSHYWTSGLNCTVVKTENWSKQLDDLFQNKESFFVSYAKKSELFEPLINEISRLYNKLKRQKTSLISSDSAKMNL